jgi:hypothetical protein
VVCPAPMISVVLPVIRRSRAGRSRSKAAKLRVLRGCRGGALRRHVELVGSGAGAGEEAQASPFAELGEHVPGFDVQQDGEFMAAPVARGLAGDDRGDPFPAGGRPGQAGWHGPVAAGPAGLKVHGRGADGDVDRGDGGGAGRAAVVAVEVPGGGAFDLRALYRGRRAGSKVARTARPIAPGRPAGPSGQTPWAAVSWSLAASSAVVKLARSGSVPGRVSTASTMVMRSSW